MSLKNQGRRSKLLDIHREQAARVYPVSISSNDLIDDGKEPSVSTFRRIDSSSDRRGNSNAPTPVLAFKDDDYNSERPIATLPWGRPGFGQQPAEDTYSSPSSIGLNGQRSSRCRCCCDFSRNAYRVILAFLLGCLIAAIVAIVVLIETNKLYLPGISTPPSKPPSTDHSVVQAPGSAPQLDGATNLTPMPLSQKGNDLAATQRIFRGSLLVRNGQYLPDLANVNSPYYLARAAEFQVRIRRAFADESSLLPLLRTIDILGFSPGSLQILFQLTFALQPGDSLTIPALQAALAQAAQRNQLTTSAFYNIDIPTDSIKIWEQTPENSSSLTTSLITINNLWQPQAILPPPTTTTTTAGPLPASMRPQPLVPPPSLPSNVQPVAPPPPLLPSLRPPPGAPIVPWGGSPIGPDQLFAPELIQRPPVPNPAAIPMMQSPNITAQPSRDSVVMQASATGSAALPEVCPPDQVGCVEGVIPFCAGLGYNRTRYPNALGHKNRNEVLAAAGFFQVMETFKCHPAIHNFSCHLLQPPCQNDTSIAIPFCQPFCMNIMQSCGPFFQSTDFVRKINCDGLEGERSAPNCFQTCSQDDFVCAKSGLCLSSTWKCDRKFDCGSMDLSDEMGCVCNTTDVFLCSNGVCISERKSCNNVNDCGNWEDEIPCTCQQGFRKCRTTGQCYPARYWCDYRFNCADRSDEEGCTCSPTDIVCQEGFCKPATARCDGINDCGDFSDEFDCECGSEFEYRCDKYLCKQYMKTWCNKRMDCDDKTDEPPGCTCKEYQFKCNNGQCIPISERCDRVPQCDDNSDEADCGCADTEFSCGPGGPCIPSEYVCDGNPQCPGSTDELQNCTCTSRQFPCANGICVPNTFWCDTRRDCPHGEDELPDCADKCPPTYPMRCESSDNRPLCIHKSQICDGHFDCRDKNDEKNCFCKPETFFPCDDGYCKKWSAWCNGIRDCEDGSDEEANCACIAGRQLPCRRGGCFLKEERCDGVRNCPLDNTDEINCSCTEYFNVTARAKLCDNRADCQDFGDELLSMCAGCTPEMFYCGSTGPCINMQRVCDGRSDCPEGEDEKYCLHLFLEEPNHMRYWEFPEVGFLYGRQQNSWYKVCADNIQSLPRDQQLKFGNDVCTKVFHYKRAYSVTIVNDINVSQIYLSIAQPLEILNSLPRLSTTLCPNKYTVVIGCQEMECGQRLVGTRTTARIVGGDATTVGRWPFYASVVRDGKHWCGGTIIDPNWILSAAHCYSRPPIQLDGRSAPSSAAFPEAAKYLFDEPPEFGSTFTTATLHKGSLPPFAQPMLLEDDNPAQQNNYAVRVGVSRNSSLSPFDQFRRVTHIIRHPQYSYRSGYNDLALLRLEKPLEFSAFVQPACLPERRQNVPQGTLCYALGLGTLGWKMRAADELREVLLPVMEMPECRRFPTINFEYRIQDFQLCAGRPEGGMDTCQGDSGGPLMCQRSSDHRFVLTGVVSKGYACAQPQTPGIYSKVSMFLQWISSTTSRDVVPVPSNCNATRQFSCHLGNCVDNDFRCNGIRDCAFGEDEQNCVIPATPVVSPTGTLPGGS